MRIGSEAPKRRTHSSNRHDSQGACRESATSNRHRYPITRARNSQGTFSVLQSLCRTQNDAVRYTLRGLVAELAERGLKVDYRTVWNFVHAEQLSFKKSVVAGERDRPDVARRRAQWAKYQNRIAPERLVFVDETWTKTNMAPLRGWGPCGRRIKAKVPYGRWNTTTFLAALRHDRIAAPVLRRPVEHAPQHRVAGGHQAAPAAQSARAARL